MNGKIGVLIDVAADVDIELAKDLAMHVAASQPEYISASEVPQERLNEEKDVLKNQMRNEGKPEEILDKIISGKSIGILSNYLFIRSRICKDQIKVKQLLPNEASVNTFFRVYLIIRVIVF